MLFAAVISGILLEICTLFAAYLLYNREKNKVIQAFIDYVTPAKDGEHKGESQLSIFAETISKMMIGQAIVSLKAMNMQVKSVEARHAQKDQENQVASVLGGINPLLGLAATAFPDLSKNLLKNPALASAAAGLVNQYIAKSNGEGNHHEPVNMFGVD